MFNYRATTDLHSHLHLLPSPHNCQSKSIIHSLYLHISFHPVIHEPDTDHSFTYSFILTPPHSATNHSLTHYIIIHHSILSSISQLHTPSLDLHLSFHTLIHQPLNQSFTSSSIPPFSHPFILWPMTHLSHIPSIILPPLIHKPTTDPLTTFSSPFYHLIYQPTSDALSSSSILLFCHPSANQ